MPRVSIIMGAYNCESTVKESIDSILNQSFTDWEFIICDDASVDNTLSILNSYSRKYPGKFKILHNDKNLMLSGSLNRCLKEANGEYIARMDADDISVSNRLEMQVSYLDQNPQYSVVGSYMQSFDENGVFEIIHKKKEPTKFDVPKSNPFHHATILMKKSVYDDLNGYTVSERTRRVEDLDLWFRFFSKGYIGYNIPEPLYLVRVDELAYKRRKLKYFVDTSYVLYNGIKLLHLPKKNYLYVVKPIVSYFTPEKLKISFRKHHSK